MARVDPDGSARVVAKGMLLPNGQTLSADGRTLIVAESAGQRLSAFTVGANGSLTGRRVWASFGEPATATALPEVIAQVSVWPDGIALDAAGAVWVANPFGKEALRVVEGSNLPLCVTPLRDMSAGTAPMAHRQPIAHASARCRPRWRTPRL